MSRNLRSNTCPECRHGRIPCDGARPSCERCRKSGHICSGYEEPWQFQGNTRASLQIGPPSSYPIPPPSEITMCEQLPWSPSPAPLQVAHQDSAAFSHSPGSTTLYSCLHPKCTGEFQDVTSLRWHVMEHFKPDHMIEKDYGCDEIKLEHDKDVSHFSVYYRNSDLPLATDTFGQSPYDMSLPSVPAWHNDAEVCEEPSSLSCPSNCYLSPSYPNSYPTWPTSDCFAVPGLEVYSGSAAGQQLRNTQGDDYRRALNGGLTSQPIHTMSNRSEPPENTSLQYRPMSMDLNGRPEIAYACLVIPCGRIFRNLDRLRRHIKTHFQERPESKLKCSIKASELACEITTEERSSPTNKKQKRNSGYANSAFGSSIKPEEKLVSEQSKATQAKGVAKTLVIPSSEIKQEVESSNSLAETSAGLESSIRVVSPDHVRHSNTTQLPFGHPKSRDWRQILPSIKVGMQAILGSGNGGAIELFCVEELPTICVTCWDPSKVDYKNLTTCMRPLDLPIVIAKGKIRKSMDGQCYNSDGKASGGSSRFREVKPPIHGHYMRRPDCGASLGVSEGPLSPWKVTLGGYVSLKYIDRDEWVTYAMTVHHVLVEDGPTNQASSDECNDDDENMIEPDYDYAPGVDAGVLGGAGDLTKEITFSSPARPDLKNLTSRLESKVAICCKSEQYAKINDVETLSSLLKELRHSDSTSFGRAAWSSGLTLAEGVEMDWLLIDSIPSRRLGRNYSGDAAAFMEGSNGNIDGSWQSWTPSDYVDETAFETLMEFTGCEWDEKDPSNYGFMSRVFGRGSESGLADGFLSPISSVFYDPKYGSYDGWAFCPRNARGLGYSGDSGTWIYNSEGKLLGQIISYNRDRHITYFTPTCKAFKHIKYVTGAIEVKLLTPDGTDSALPTAYGLLSPQKSPPEAPRQTAKISAKRKIRAPSTPAMTPY